MSLTERTATLREQLQRLGFARMTIPPSLEESVGTLRQFAKDIHALSDDEKKDIALYKSNGLRGYSAGGAQTSYGSEAEKERSYTSFEMGFEFTKPMNDLEKLLYASNQWPSALSGYQSAVERALCEWRDFSVKILACILECDKMYLSPFFAKQTSNMRLMHYSGHKKTKIPSHRDYEFLTIICATEPSLTVKQGDKDRSVGELPSELIVLPGDCLEYISCGAVSATEHAVECDKERISIVYFLSPDADVAINHDGTFTRRADYMDEKQLFFPAKHLAGMTLANNSILRGRYTDPAIQSLIPHDLKNPMRRNKPSSNHRAEGY